MNLFNEYYDFKCGLDIEDFVGIGGVIVRYGMKLKMVLNLVFIFYGIVFILGVYICVNSSWWFVLVGLVGMVIGYLYMGGLFLIVYMLFGELFLGFCMGVMFVLILFFI